MNRFRSIIDLIKSESWGGHCDQCAFNTVHDRQKMCGTFNDPLTQRDFVAMIESREEKNMWSVHDADEDRFFTRIDGKATCDKHAIEVPPALTSVPVETWPEHLRRVVRMAKLETKVEESDSEEYDSDSDSDCIKFKKRELKKRKEHHELNRPKQPEVKTTWLERQLANKQHELTKWRERRRKEEEAEADSTDSSDSDFFIRPKTKRRRGGGSQYGFPK
jgi:hypothetical protein